jgi:two-component system, chemotaxis family, sensor kinase CheA
MTMAFSDHDLELLRITFGLQSEELLGEMEAHLVALERAPQDDQLLNEIFRVVHTIKGDARMIGLSQVAQAAHRMEDTLSRLRDGEIRVTAELVTDLLQEADAIRQMITEELDDREAGDAAGPEVARGLALAPFGNGSRELVPSTGTPGSVHPAGMPAATLRVDVAKLDRILDLAGEITIARGRVTRFLDGISGEAAAAIGEIYEELSRLHSELQDEVMRARMVIVGPMLRSYNRTVRELARSQGKDATFVIEGGDVEVDTRVLELLRDPLVHMLRNAIDHGIEPPEVRSARGKPRDGQIRLAAAHEGGQIVLRLSDDGAGLDPRLIAARVRALGLAASPEALPLRDLLRFIFAPGFSTARAVTQLSGRGVGMDIVRRNVEALRGSIDIESVPGQGTTFVLRLPLTLAIIDGFSVTVGPETYILPLATVIECLSLPAEGLDRHAVHGVIDVRGTAVPFVRLRRRFGVDGEAPAREHAVIVEHDGGQAAFVVDALLGSGQAVIKSLGRALHATPGLAGATILGTGRVALILDLPALLADAVTPVPH